MGMSCLDCHDYMDGYNRGKREGAIEELEKIKARIDKDVAYVSKWQVKNDSIEIINERISELKGEKK